MNKFLALTLILLSGCASVRESYAPDGRKAYALNCSGLARGWDKCQIAAGEKCGSAGYDVLDKSSERGGMLLANGNTVTAANSMERSMLIACKDGR